MSDGAKKETVYGGFSPGPQSTVYSGSAAAPTTATTAPVRTGVASEVVGGASWFYWIAGLSLINSVILLSGGRWHFMLGLGITDFMSAIGTLTGTNGAVVTFVINLVIAGIVVLFGFFASKGQKWAFLVGMVLYALDGGLTLLFRDFFSAAFHGYALFRIYNGFKHTD